MIDVADSLRGATVSCKFPDCSLSELPVGKARVMDGGDSLDAILARVLCTAHDEAAQKRKVRTTWLLQRLRSFVQQKVETEVADVFFETFAKKQAYNEPRSQGNGRNTFNTPRFRE